MNRGAAGRRWGSSAARVPCCFVSSEHSKRCLSGLEAGFYGGLRWRRQHNFPGGSISAQSLLCSAVLFLPRDELICSGGEVFGGCPCHEPHVPVCPAGRAEHTELSGCSEDGELPASLGGRLASREGNSRCKAPSDAELSKHCPCVELGCACSLLCSHSARIPFPGLESSPGCAFALVTLCSGLVGEQQVLNIAFCKGWRSLASASEKFVCSVPGLSRNEE